MSVPKIMGSETEYGISVRNADRNDPVTASALVVNSYKNEDVSKIVWDYAQENPLMDARGFQVDEDKVNEEEQRISIADDILVNGGRYYVDHAHPEYCTPECFNPRDFLIYEKAGELILNISRAAAERTMQNNQKIVIHKDNTDRKGHSYGYHENYLMDRTLPFENIVEGLTPFLVTRQIYAGSGKIGTENGGEAVDYQISQRADFIETEVSLSTMVNRPIINTRDEPHAELQLYRRLHVIVGDANMSEYAIYLKAGATAIVLELIEEGVINTQFKLEKPVEAIKSISRDLSCKKKLKLKDGRKLNPIEIQREYLKIADKYFTQKENCSEITKDILEKWEFVLDKLEEDPMQLARHLDWVIKRNLIDGYMKRHDLDWSSHRVLMLDLQYHDVRPEKGLYYKLLQNNAVEKIVSQDEIIQAVTNPPVDTRAYFRGMILQKYPKQIYGASWNSVIFDLEESTFDKIMLDHPERGTKALVGELLENCKDASELVKALQK